MRSAGNGSHRPGSLAAPVLFLLVAPNLLWALLDRGPWISDTSYYGWLACRLYDSLGEGGLRWRDEMLSGQFKPPLVPWLGQLFVPLGRSLGSVDSGLLLLPVGASFAALLLLDRTLRGLGHTTAVRWCGCLTLAAAPVFTEVTTQFYTQPLQLAAVCWLILIMVRAKEWPPLRTALQLVAAGSTAMLTTLSSPVFCAVPVLVAAAAAARAFRQHSLRRDALRATLPLAGATMLILGLTLAWYARNHEAALAYASWGYNWLHADLVSSPGGSTSRVLKLGVWLELLARDLWLKPGPLSATLILAGAAAGRRSRVPGQSRLPLILPGLQFALLLAVFSSAGSQDYLYLLPLVPFVALALAEGLSRVGKGWLTGAALALLATQWASIHLERLGLVPAGSRFQRIQVTRHPSFDLMDSVARLGRQLPSGTILLATGTLPIHSLDVLYFASKTGDYRGPSARYQSVEFLLIGSFENGAASRSADQVWQLIQAMRPDYVVLLDRQARLAQRDSERWRSTGTWRDVLMSALDISDRIAGSSSFRRTGVVEHPGIEVYEPRDP